MPLIANYDPFKEVEWTGLRRLTTQPWNWIMKNPRHFDVYDLFARIPLARST